MQDVQDIKGQCTYNEIKFLSVVPFIFNIVYLEYKIRRNTAVSQYFLQIFN